MGASIVHEVYVVSVWEGAIYQLCLSEDHILLADNCAILIVDSLGFFDKTEDITHAEDTRRESVWVELFKFIGELLEILIVLSWPTCFTRALYRKIIAIVVLHCLILCPSPGLTFWYSC